MRVFRGGHLSAPPRVRNTPDRDAAINSSPPGAPRLVKGSRTERMTSDSPVDFGGGLFMSRVTTEDFEPDPDVPGTAQHVLYAGADVSAGMSRVISDADPIMWTLPQREFLLVLEGTARIEIKDG